MEDDAERARRAYLSTEYWFPPGILFPTMAATRAYRGDAVGAHEALDGWDAVQERRSRRYRPLIDALVGNVAAATTSLESRPFRFLTDVQAPNLVLSGAIAAQAELGALVHVPGIVRGPVDALIDLYERGMRFTVGWPAFIPHVIALGLDALGKAEASDEWFDRALADAEAARADAEVGRTALDHGRVLHARGDDAKADELLALAGDRYSAMSVRPLTAGSALLPRRASGSTDPQNTSATRVVLVTDLAGSTALNEQIGDRNYVTLLREHDTIIRRQLAYYDGVEFKHTGDGIAAWFYSVNHTLECAVALRHQFEAAWAGPSRTRLAVKIALSAGEPTLVDGDLLGLSVTVAFRALEHAQPGEVLVTSDVAGLARGLSWSFDARGSRALKGLNEPVGLLTVSSRGKA